MPATYNLESYNNATLTFNVTWQTTGTSPTPISLSNYNALMQVRQYVGSDTALITVSTAPGTGILIDASTGTLTITILPALYASVPAGTYYYDLVVIDSNNNPTPLLTGTFTILQGISESNAPITVITTAAAPASVDYLNVNNTFQVLGNEIVNSTKISGGTIDNTAIGSSIESTGAFTTLTNSTSAALVNLTCSTVDLTGGSINNIIIGGSTPQEGFFTTISSTGNANLNSMSSASVLITGGTVDSTVIGATTPDNGTFSNLKATTSFVISPSATTQTPLFQTSDSFSDFIVNGLQGSTTTSTLTMTITAGAAYCIGTRVLILSGNAGLTNTYAASTTTYVDLSNTGVFTYTTSTTVTVNSLRLMEVVTNTTEITSVTQLALSFPTINASSAKNNNEVLTLGQGNSLYNPLLGYTPIQNVLTTLGDMLYEGSSGAVRLPIGSASQVLSVSGGIPTWVTLSGSSTLTASDVDNALGYVPATSGANSDITSITGLTTPLSVSQGGTGVNTLTGIAYGNGTGAFTPATSAELISTLGYTPATSGANSDITSLTGLTSPLPVPNATGSTDAINLGQAESLFAYSGESGQNVITIGAATTLTSAQSGLTILTTATASFTITLPAAASGLTYKIYGNTSFAINVSLPSGATNSILFPDGSTNTAYTLVVSEGYNQFIELLCDGANWRAQTSGYLITAAAVNGNNAVNLGQLQNQSTSIFVSEFSTWKNFSGFAGVLPASGLTIGWNYTNSGGEVDLFLGPQAGNGGLNMYQLNGSGDIGANIFSLTGTGSLTIGGTLTLSPATTGNQAVTLNQITNGSIGPNFTSITLTGTGGTSLIYSDASGVGTANDFVIRTGASGSYYYNSINGTNGYLNTQGLVSAGPISGTTLSSTGITVSQAAGNSSGVNGLTINGASFPQINLAYSGVGNKFIRVNSGNDLSIVNSAYSSELLVLQDNGQLDVPVGAVYITGGYSTSYSNYGFINYNNAGVISGSSGTVTVGLYVANRIQCSECDATSDVRLKENIKEIDELTALDFVKNIDPVEFNWIRDKRKSSGYIAQKLLKRGFYHVIGASTNLELQEHVDNDGFKSAAGTELSVNYAATIPYLHKALAVALDRIEKLENIIANMEMKNGNVS